MSVTHDSSWGGLSPRGVSEACGWEKRPTQDHSTSDEEPLVRPNVGRDVIPKETGQFFVKITERHPT